MKNEERLRRKITELEEKWDLLSEKLSKLEKDRILKNDPSEKLRLEKEIAEATTERDQIEQQLNDLESQLPAEDEKQSEFVNRFHELQFITNIYCPPYLLINAPAGYGKSRLIENVKERLQQQNWLCIHLKLSRERVYSIENLAANIFQQLQEAPPEKILPEKAGYEIGRSILKALQSYQKNVLLLIDEAETLNEKVVTQLLNHCLPAIKEGLSIADTSLKLRLICAGRNLSRWKQWGSKLPLELMALTSFDFPAVSETAAKFSAAHQVKTSPEYQQDFAAYLMYFTGGHPGCMSNILKKDYGSPINLLVSNAMEYYKTMVTPVIEEIREHIPVHLQEVFETLSVFRMYNYPLLQNIIDAGMITYQGNVVSLESELTATYLVERKYGFIQDDIVRRLLAIWLRQEQRPKAFGELCGRARQIIQAYLQETTYHPHSVALEGLYQELQCEYYQTDQTPETRQVLSEKFFTQDGILQTYLNLLAKKPDVPDTLANLQQILQSRKDWELQFTLNFFLRKEQHYTDEPYQRLLKEVEQFVSQSDRGTL